MKFQRFSEASYAHFVTTKTFQNKKIFDDDELNEKLNYIHYNPVRAELCVEPGERPWSSYRHYKFGKQFKIKIDNIIYED